MLHNSHNSSAESSVSEAEDFFFRAGLPRPDRAASEDSDCALLEPSPFDAEEPLFTGSNWHPVVIYQRVNVFIGHPYRITHQEKAAYKGQNRISLANGIADYCRQEIITLLK